MYQIKTQTFKLFFLQVFFFFAKLFKKHFLFIARVFGLHSFDDRTSIASGRFIICGDCVSRLVPRLEKVHDFFVYFSKLHFSVFFFKPATHRYVSVSRIKWFPYLLAMFGWVLALSIVVFIPVDVESVFHSTTNDFSPCFNFY